MSDGYDQFVKGLHAALLIGACALVGAAIAVLWHIDRAARELGPTLTDVHRTVLIAGGAATDIEKTLKIERDAATAQISAANQAARSLARAGAAADILISQTNDSLNSPAGVLPTLGAAISESQAQFTALERQAETNLSDLDEAERTLTPAIENFNRASASLADALPPILANVRDTTAQTVTISENLAGTTDAIDASAHDIQAFIHRETTPVRGTWNVVKGFLTTFAGPASSVATAARTK